LHNVSRFIDDSERAIEEMDTCKSIMSVANQFHVEFKLNLFLKGYKKKTPQEAQSKGRTLSRRDLSNYFI
jgi:hypothetical protein